MLKRKIVATAKAISWSSASRIGPTVTIAVAPQIAVPTPMRVTSRDGARSQRPASAGSPRAGPMGAARPAPPPPPPPQPRRRAEGEDGRAEEPFQRILQAGNVNGGQARGVADGHPRGQGEHRRADQRDEAAKHPRRGGNDCDRRYSREGRAPPRPP